MQSLISKTPENKWKSFYQVTATITAQISGKKHSKKDSSWLFKNYLNSHQY